MPRRITQRRDAIGQGLVHRQATVARLEGAMSDAEPGEWPNGWQCHASPSSEHTFRKNAVLNQSCVADQSHLRSHWGPGTSEALSVCPMKPEFRIEASLPRTVVLERLRLQLQVSEAHCGCVAVSAQDWQWTSHSGASGRDGTPRSSQGRRRRVHERARTEKGRAPNSCGGTDVASLLSRWKEDGVRKPFSLWKAWRPSLFVMPHVLCSSPPHWLGFARSLVAMPTALHALGGANGAPDLAGLFAEGQF